MHVENSKKYCAKARLFEHRYDMIADLLYEIGIAFHENGNLDEARETLLEALEICPQSKIIHNALGNVYYTNCEYGKAESEYHLSLYLDQSFTKRYRFFAHLYQARFLYPLISALYKIIPYPYNGLGNIYYAEKMYDKAFSMYSRATQVQRNFSSPYHNLGNIHLYDESMKSLSRAEYYYKQSIKYSKKRLHYPYIGLSMVYYFRALDSVHDLQNYTSFLNKAKVEILHAICLYQGEVLYWNLGVIEYMLNNGLEASLAWVKASTLARKRIDGNIGNKLDALLLESICNCINSSLNCGTEAVQADYINTIRESAEIHSTQKGTIEQYLKDLSGLRRRPNGTEPQCIATVITVLQECLLLPETNTSQARTEA